MTSFAKLSLKGTIAFSLAAMLVTACGNHGDSGPKPATRSMTAPQTEFTNWPPQVDQFRFHWSAAPSIDLGTGPSVALRAYVESYVLVQISGVETATYPGFDRATPANVGSPGNPDPLFQLVDVRPSPPTSNVEHEDNRRVAGYQPTHVLSLEPHGASYRATVCLGLYSVYRTVGDTQDRYVSALADPATGRAMYTGSGKAREGGVDVWVVELTNRGPQVAVESPAPDGPQIGTRPAPMGDVFGNWSITGRSSGVWGTIESTEDVVTPEIQKQCAAAMPDDAATREAMANGFHQKPPPHGDAIPGWPATVK